MCSACHCLPALARLQEQTLTLRPDGEGEAAAAPVLHPRPDGDAELEFPAGRWRPHTSPGGTVMGNSSSNSSSGTAGQQDPASAAAAPQQPQQAQQRPDGDAELDPLALGAAGFVVPPCPACGGILKPHVVFFGDSIPKDRADAAAALAGGADAMLVVGSSLQVYSAFRYAHCRRQSRVGMVVCRLQTLWELPPDSCPPKAEQH